MNQPYHLRINILTEYLSFRKRLKNIIKSEGHRSRGARRPKVLKEKEGELAKRIAKLAKNGFPLTGKKVQKVKNAHENRIKGFSVKHAAPGYIWLCNFIQHHKKLKVKKASQINKNGASSLIPQFVLAWFREHVTGIIQKYKITDPRCIWNIDESNVTNILQEQKFVSKKGKKLNQVVGSEQAETSTIIGCINAAGEKMPPLIIHKGVRVPA